METFLIKAAQLILAFVILVTVHEFGHYIFARMFGMRVSKFYLFFNPWFSILKYNPRQGTLQLIGWTSKAKDGNEEPRALKTFRVGKPRPAKDPDKPTWRDTIYGLGWLPLGGYCAIDGMVDETTSADSLAAEPKPWEFRAKKPLPRLMVMIAGVLMNFILAIVIYIGIALYWGDVHVQYGSLKEGFDYGRQLTQAGFNPGDRPISIDGKTLTGNEDSMIWDLIQDGAVIKVVTMDGDTVDHVIPAGTTEALAAQNEPAGTMALRMPVYVARTVHGEGAQQAGILPDDRIVKVAADTTPSFTELTASLTANAGKTVPVTVMRGNRQVTADTRINGDGKIGIELKPLQEIYPVDTVTYGFFESIPVGIGKGVDRLTTYVSSLKLLFTKTGAQSLGGFAAIGDMYPDKWDWEKFWNLTAFLSVILAFMNILPIPALDGGHALFTLVELVTRRRPSDKFLGYAQMVGMAVLLLLLVYANGNDIYRLFFK